jgi:hypothetical protein
MELSALADLVRTSVPLRPAAMCPEPGLTSIISGLRAQLLHKSHDHARRKFNQSDPRVEKLVLVALDITHQLRQPHNHRNGSDQRDGRVCGSMLSRGIVANRSIVCPRSS